MKPQSRSRNYLVGAALLVIVLCCGCVATAVALPFAAPAGSSGPVQANVCIGAITQPKFQVGMWWQLIYMSRLLPATVSPYAACTFITWPAMFSPAGEVAFPP